MGGVIGWAGYESALELLIHGYRVRGGELIAEVERLKILEASQMEIENKRLAMKTKGTDTKLDAERVEGDLSDIETEEPD
jgi:hypothetical protein